MQDTNLIIQERGNQLLELIADYGIRFYLPRGFKAFVQDDIDYMHDLITQEADATRGLL